MIRFSQATHMDHGILRQFPARRGHAARFHGYDLGSLLSDCRRWLPFRHLVYGIYMDQSWNFSTQPLSSRRPCGSSVCAAGQQADPKKCLLGTPGVCAWLWIYMGAASRIPDVASPCLPSDTGVDGYFGSSGFQKRNPFGRLPGPHRKTHMAVQHVQRPGRISAVFAICACVPRL